MAEVLATYTNPVLADDGTAYRAQACGAPNRHGLWEGWIEFVPVESGGPPLCSSRETTQPNRTDAEYWATGLTPVYLEGALHRARNPLVRKTARQPQPLFEAPAGRSVAPAGGVPVGHQAVLDPFSVYVKGETLLRNELRALSSWHLVNIILAYRLSPDSESELNRLSASALVEIIVSGVQQRA